MGQKDGLDPSSAWHSSDAPPYSHWHSAVDPRTSSTQSLTPSVEIPDDGTGDPRRRLLVIYIHGYQGNDQSFRQFPFHIHQYLKLMLESHVIHTKIYPRYKTYRSLELARDNFSRWLEPHESDKTDVILVGHSMGGLLAAEVALMPNQNPYSQHPFKHRILGTLSLDSPFLGLHPGIVVSGIASLFRPSPENANESGEASQGSQAADLPPPGPLENRADTNFNPPFFNDILFRERPFKQRLAHFAQKHRNEGMFNAVTEHFKSHLQYGGCLADYTSLNIRYDKLRALEDVNDLPTQEGSGAQLSSGRRPGNVRIRFINYFTICTGFPKVPKPENPKPEEPETLLKPDDARLSSESPADGSTPRISIEDHSDTSNPETLAEIDPEDGEIMEKFQSLSNDTPISPSTSPLPDDPELPTIPPTPEAPTPPDLGSFETKESRQQAEREAKTAQKQFEQAVKAREKVIKERQKLISKRQKEAQKEAERQRKLEQKKQAQQEREARKALEASGEKAVAKPPKERKFCNLPRAINGVRDAKWVRVDMGAVDEVGAHCGLFIPGAHYDRLVGDVGGRMASWVHDEMTRRAILSMSL